MRFVIAFGFLELALCGCRSHPLGPYVSPRVVGRVLAADSGQPLSDVRVVRGKPEHQPLAGWTPKGGELLMRKPPAMTAVDGHFDLASERVLSLVRGSGWNQVQLTFEHNGYQVLRTNCSTTLATNSPAAEPVLNIGDVQMRRE